MMGDHAGAREELSKVLGHNVPPEDLAKLVDAFKNIAPAQTPAPVASAAKP